MVAGVLPAPIGIGGQGQQAAQAAQGIVRPALGQEGAVAAVVLDDEDPHQKAGGDRRQQQRQQVGCAQQGVHRRATGEEAAERGRDLDQAAMEDRPLELRGDAPDLTVMVRRRGGGRRRAAAGLRPRRRAGVSSE